jgi:hypothetical protein
MACRPARRDIQEDWPSPTFATWLSVAWIHDLVPEFKSLSKWSNLPDTFESPEELIDWLSDRREFHLALNGARVIWRRFANWRAIHTGTKRPARTDEEGEARKDREGLIAFGVLPDPALGKAFE